jgi:type VI secretion system secreted protein VgrG
VIGALWNGKDKPMKDAYTDENTTRMIQTKSGHQIVLNDKSGEEKITIADKSGKRTLTFDVKDKKFLVEAKEGDVEIHAKKKLVLHCEDLEIKTKKTGKIDIGSTFDLKVAQKAGFKAGPKMVLKAGKVNLNPPSPPSRR